MFPLKCSSRNKHVGSLARSVAGTFCDVEEKFELDAWLAGIDAVGTCDKGELCSERQRSQKSTPDVSN